MSDQTARRTTSDEIDRAIDVVARDLTSIDAPADLKALVLTELSESHAPAFERRALGWSLPWAMASAAAAILVASFAWWVATKPAAGPEQRFASEVGGGVRPPIVSAPAAGGTRAEGTVAAGPVSASPVIRRSVAQRSVAAAVPDDAMSNAPTMAAIAAIEAIAQSPIEFEQISIAAISIAELTAIAEIEIGEIPGSEEQ